MSSDCRMVQRETKHTLFHTGKDTKTIGKVHTHHTTHTHTHCVHEFKFEHQTHSCDHENTNFALEMEGGPSQTSANDITFSSTQTYNTVSCKRRMYVQYTMNEKTERNRVYICAYMGVCVCVRERENSKMCRGVTLYH